MVLLIVGCNKDDDLKTAPVAPSNLTATTISVSQIDLIWKDNSSDENGFKIERKRDTENFSLIATLSSDETSYSDTNLDDNTDYSYRIHAFNASFPTGEYSNIAHSVTLSKSAPTLSTDPISLITVYTAKSGGTVEDDGDSPILTRGVIWSVNANPTVELASKTEDGNGIGAFTSDISELAWDTEYHVRSYATNAAGTGYGSDIVFTSVRPTLVTEPITEISITSASSGGTLIGVTEEMVLSSMSGVVWGLNPNPTIDLDTKSEQGGFTQWQTQITGLEGKTTYYLRAYATDLSEHSNDTRIIYGDELVFSTIEEIHPLITISSRPVAIGNIHATVEAQLVSEGSGMVFQSGITWSKNPNPQIDTSPTATNDMGLGTFTVQVTKLNLNTSYYARAYVVSEFGTDYSEEIQFTTTSDPLILGDATEGGVVAYILVSGDLGYDPSLPHGLIISETDLSLEAPWGCFATNVSGADESAIGSGLQNTLDIMAACNESNTFYESPTAAMLCANMVLNDYDDWYLPSKDELNKFYENKSILLSGGVSFSEVTKDCCGNERETYYWSSTEQEDADGAWMQYFVDGKQFYYASSYPMLQAVRATRSF